MEKVVAKVTSVQVMKDRNGKPLFNVKLVLDKEFKAFVQKRDDEGNLIPEQFEEKMVNYISVNQFQLAEQIITNDADIAMFAAIVGDRFEQAQFGASMQGADITIERELVAKDSTYQDYLGNDVVADRDKYFVKKVIVKPSQMNKMLMEKTMMARLGANA